MLHAKWIEDKFPLVYREDDEITFDGTNYINTHVKLYNDANYDKDYEIGFTITEYVPSIQEKQAVFMNAAYENAQAKYPGIISRRDSTSNNMEVTHSIAGYKQSLRINNIQNSIPITMRIYRIDGIVYYKFNDGDLVTVQDMNSYNRQTFETEVWFGAGDDGTGNPFRFVKAKMSNMYVRLGEYEEKETHSVTYPDGSVENYMHGSVINLPSNEESKPNEELSTVTFKYHDGVTEDTTSKVQKEFIKNGFMISGIHYDDESTLLINENKVLEYAYDEKVISAAFPNNPTRDNYTFDGWYTEEVGGEKVEEYSSLEDITLHAHWTLDLPTDITIDSDNVTLIVGELHQTEVTFTPEGTTDTFTYTGYDNNIISVTDGLITGLSKGETTTITIGTENTDITKEINVTVLSDKLESNVYSVTDKVRPKEDPEEEDITDRIVIGVKDETYISEFKDNMLNPNEYIKIYDKDGNEVEGSEIVRTGLTIKLEYNGIVLDEASMVVRGDVDGDGFVNVSDYISVLNHALSLETVEDYISFTAGDVEEDNMLNVSDYIKIMDYALRNIDSIND